MGITMKILLILTTFLIATSSFAQNPQIRTCRIKNAVFWSLKINEPQNDNIGFCRYGGAMMGSLSFMKYFYENKNSQAMDALYKTQNMNISTCSSVGASQIVGIESPSAKAWDLCVFGDYSFVGLRTLQEGWFSEFNADLVQNL